MENKITLKRSDLEKIFSNDNEVIEIIEEIDEEINIEVFVEYKNGFAIDLKLGFSDGFGEIFENIITLKDIVNYE